MDDTAIIELYWAKNQDAIAETDLAYGRQLHTLSHRIVLNHEDAEECVSDTYLKAWDSIPPKRPNHLFAYLAKICRHFALGRLDWRNAARRKAEVVSLTQEMESCIPDKQIEAQMEGEELGRLLEQFLASLPKDSRLIFLRRYLYLDTVAEIAARYGMTESKVKTQLHRTRKMLAEFLQKEGVRV